MGIAGLRLDRDDAVAGRRAADHLRRPAGAGARARRLPRHRLRWSATGRAALLWLEVDEPAPVRPKSRGLFPWLGGQLGSGVNWRHAAYCLLHFPWGVFTFSVTVSFLDLRLGAADVSAVALGLPGLLRAAGPPGLRQRRRPARLVAAHPGGHGAERGRRRAAGAAHAVAGTGHGARGPDDGGRAARPVPAGQPRHRAGVGPRCGAGHLGGRPAPDRAGPARRRAGPAGRAGDGPGPGQGEAARGPAGRGGAWWRRRTAR